MSEEEKNQLNELETLVKSAIGEDTAIDYAEVTMAVLSWMERYGHSKGWLEERIETGIPDQAAFDAVALVLRKYIA